MTLITLGPAWLAGILLARWLAPPLAVLALLAVPTLAALLLDRASLRLHLDLSPNHYSDPVENHVLVPLCIS
jgi:hypothetical protein